MATFDATIRPYTPQARATHFEQNAIPGWIPATIESIEDENNLGRIRVTSELIEPNTTLANWDDGSILVLEDFTSNNSKGGSHRFLQGGSQVALLPMMGNPNCLLMLGCIHSIVDQPSPELNRAKGTYGSVTPGQVAKVNNDTDGSSIDSRPSGAVQHVSGGGDITAQTRNGARSSLLADGTVAYQNNMASSTIAPDGSVSVTNLAKGFSILNPDGTWEMKSSNNALLRLAEGAAELKGPLSSISQSVKDLGEQLPKAMNLVQEALTKASQLIEDFKAHGSVEFLTSKLTPLLNEVGEFKPIVEKALSSLNQLKKVEFDDLAEYLRPQAEAVLNSKVPDLFSTVRKTVESVTSDALLDELSTVLPDSFQDALKLVDSTVLQGLAHNPTAQVQYLTDSLTDGGLDSINSMLGLDLHEVLGSLQNSFNIPLPAWMSTDIPPTPQQEEEWRLQIATQAVKVKDLLPNQLQELFSYEDVIELIEMAVAGGDPLHAFLGKAGTKTIEGFAPKISELVDLSSKVPLINDFVAGITSGQDIPSLVSDLAGNFPGLPELESLDLNSALSSILPIALGSLTEDLKGALTDAIASGNSLLNTLGEGKSGGVLRLTKNFVEAKASESGLGAKLMVTAPKASLVGIGGLTELFADRTSAGVKTPWGSFGLGSGGGSFLSQANMAFRVFQSVGKSAGFLLNPKSGASLASFEDSDFDKDDSSKWARKSAEITVDDGVVIIRSHRSSSKDHGIIVSPDGVFIEGYRVSEYFYGFSDRLNMLESRIASLSAASATTVQIQ